MKIEIIEFYPNEYCEEKRILTGTLRVKIPAIGIHILGIFVNKNKDYWFFTLPGQKGIDHQTGEKVRYPYITFENDDQQKELIEAIRKKAPLFIEERLVDIDKSLILSQNWKTNSSQVRTPKTKVSSMEVKQIGKPIASIANKVWHDLPPRKNYTYRRYK